MDFLSLKLCSPIINKIHLSKELEKKIMRHEIAQKLKNTVNRITHLQNHIWF